jgi:peptidoglycan hydrolase CwlO-like protein
MDWNILAPIIVAFGGIELVKYIGSLIINRKGNKTLDEKTSFENNFKIYKDQIEYLSGRIKELQLSLDEKDTKIKELEESFDALKNKYIELCSIIKK